MMAKAKDDLLGICILSARQVANLHPRIILTPYKLFGKSRDYISKTGDRQEIRGREGSTPNEIGRRNWRTRDRRADEGQTGRNP
jgi:hypothetical protein